MYFSPEEVRRISVHEINDIAFFDEWSEQLEKGLYAPALGPMKLRQDNTGPCLCKTCGLEKDCPGHMGHIELACTLYNPFVLSTLQKLLCRVCLNCRKLTASDAKTNSLVGRLSRLAPGDLAKKGSLKATGKKRTALESHCEADDSSKRQWVQDISEEHGSRLLVESVPARTLTEHLQAAERLAAECRKAAAARDELTAWVAKSPGAADPSGMGPRCQISACTMSLRSALGEYCKDLPTACERCKQKPAKWKRQGYTALFIHREGQSEDALALPVYVRNILRDFWKKEERILYWLMPGARDMGAEMFFLDNVLVPPNRFRPCEAPESAEAAPRLDRQTTHLMNVLGANAEVRRWIRKEQATETKREEKDTAPPLSAIKACEGLEEAVEQLQTMVNSFMDSSKSGKHAKLAIPGIRQLLERKEGLFRMKMMGKRVNFAARSVISPDPNIETTEIGIPQMIAEELTYPEVAANHNAVILRKLVERGAEYPGAKEVHVPKPHGGKIIMRLKKMTVEKREALAKQLITDIESGKPPMTVFRQLRDGDPLLVNRQPTLHKPGIMAHIARVMKKEQTIRLHYVNCNTYNADFDGDEMNLHAPQDPIGRMEALNIARADRQYLVPTSGKPLRGLIQDHCIAGAMLSKRDSFFTRADVCLLLYTGLRAAVDIGEGGSLGRPCMEGDLRAHSQRLRLRLDPPCIIRPQRLWSGKQVFSMLLKNLVGLCSDNKVPCEMYLESGSKTPGDIWNGKLDGDKEESSVLLRGMDLLQGVLDKSQFGASSFGLTHIIHELLGAHIVGLWLASLARLLTLLLQMRGFTCAFADLFLTDATEEKRRELIRSSRQSAKAAVEQWLAKNKRQEFADGFATPAMLSEAASDLLPKSKRAQEFEGTMIGRMKENWSDLINMCIPIGQKLPFPRNCFSSMVQTGAKGSKVNQSQVSCCLGQQELEGRLPPLMCTFRALPCFASYDVASRTRGYIADRFLSGIRPQEFFFHCMAGREGLVDTAVKTSRSGYLQRCLVKHLESLKVCYDLTVRDSDGAVVQFLYGEDGADVTRASYLFNFKALQPNAQFIKGTLDKKLQTLMHLGSTGRLVDAAAAPAYIAAREAESVGNLKRAAKGLERLLAENGELDEAARSYLEAAARRLRAGGAGEPLDPSSSVLSPAHFFGSTSERHEQELKRFLEGQLTKGSISKEDAKAFTRCMQLKFMQCLAQPGEAVGVIAAQSMGEPSTQMTLNTFHLAGHGGANVTLGIPRLREIVQTASKSCSTPLMQVKVLQDESGDTTLQARLAYAQKTKSKFRHLKLMDCVRRLAVHEEVRMIGEEVTWIYTCRFMFFDIENIHAKVSHLTKERLEAFMNRSVVQKLKRQLTRVMNTVKAAAAATKPQGGGEEGEQVGLGDNAEEGVAESAAPKAAPKKRARHAARGEEDKVEAEEAMEAEAEADDQEQDDESAQSGMYSSSEDEKPKEETRDEVDPEEVNEEDVFGQEGDTEAKAASVRKEADDEVEDKEDEDEEEKPKPALGAPVLTPKLSESQGKVGKEGKAKTKQGTSTRTTKGAGTLFFQNLLRDAMESGQRVFASKLENNEMSIVVHHRYSECPHSLFVGEVLHKICKHAQMQDASCRGVKHVHVKQERGEVWLECEGVNLFALQVLGDTVDHAHIYTNNIQRVLRTYGVEAARAAVVREIRAVFGHYGIEVDHRHLSLIADYMGHAGGLRPFNRHGMVQSSSPLQQMSFETTMQFMTTACQDGLPDSVASPASALVLGQLPPVGTGMVSLLVDLDPPMPKWKEKREFTF